MEMYEVFKYALNSKYYRTEKELMVDGYEFYEGRSFSCGDYIKIRVSSDNEGESLLFYGECCKCCMAATEFVVGEYNKTREVVTEEELSDFFGKAIFNRRRECFRLPLKVMKRIQGEQ